MKMISRRLFPAIRYRKTNQSRKQLKDMEKPYANFSDEGKVIEPGLDSVVIRHYVAGIVGGRTLDVSENSEKVIRAGHVIIRDKENDIYKPMPVQDGAYGSLPGNHEYVGVLRFTVTADCPVAAIMYSGEVNDVASPYPVDTIKTALLTAVPTLVFKHD